MNRTLLKKNITESQWMLLSCSVVMFLLCWLFVWVHSQLDTEGFQRLLDILPRDWQKFSAVDFGWMVSIPGRLALTYGHPVVILCVAIWAIARGSDCVSGEVGRATMEMLLAQPVSRLQILLSHAAVTITGLVLIVAVGWLGTYTGIHSLSIQEEVAPSWKVPGLNLRVPIPLAEKEQRIVPMSDRVDANVFIPASINLLALGILLAGFSTLMSSWDQYRGRTIGIVVGASVAQLIIKIVSRATDELHWLAYTTILSGYEPEAIVQIADEIPAHAWSLVCFESPGPLYGFGPLGYDLLLAVIGLVAYVVAAIVFCRRDLPAPI